MDGEKAMAVLVVTRMKSCRKGGRITQSFAHFEFVMIYYRVQEMQGREPGDGVFLCFIHHLTH